jgi:hypothetical protein
VQLGIIEFVATADMCKCAAACYPLQIAEKHPAEFEARKKDKLRYR